MNNIVELREVKAQIEARRVPDRQRIAGHIARVSFGLSGMATRAEMPVLKHLLDMTTKEAVQHGFLSRQSRTDTH